MTSKPVIVPVTPRTLGLQRAATRSVACCSGEGNMLIRSDAVAPSLSVLAER